MSVINRIDEILRFNKNKDKPSVSNTESYLFVEPHSSSSVGTTNIPISNFQQTNPLENYTRHPDSHGVAPRVVKDFVSPKIKGKECPLRGIGDKGKLISVKRTEYYSSSSLNLSSDDDPGPIREISTEQLASQNNQQKFKTDQKGGVREIQVAENIKRRLDLTKKEEDYGDDRLELQENNSNEKVQDRSQLELEDIHQTESEIFLREDAVSRYSQETRSIERYQDSTLSKSSEENSKQYKQDPLGAYHRNSKQSIIKSCPVQNCEQVFENSKRVKSDIVMKENQTDRALESLKTIPLEQISLTSAGSFETNVGITQHYLDLCYMADKNPLRYYHENYKGEKKFRNTNEVGEEQKFLALEKLRKFPLEELRVTMAGLFDKRFKLTHDYLELCIAAKIDPVKYYEENFLQIQKQLVVSAGALEELKSFRLEDLRVTMNGSFDKRFNVTHEYLKLCLKAKKDPLQYYNENYTQKQKNNSCINSAALDELRKFPLETLTMTKKGFFDRRFNVTHSYLDLCTKANKDPFHYYHENIKR